MQRRKLTLFTFYIFQDVYESDKELPVFQNGKRDRYTVPQAIKILLEKQNMKCSKVPLRVRQNLSFIIDVKKLKHWEDIKSDMNGSYSHTLRIATWTIEIDENKEVNAIVKKKIELKSSNQLYIHVHSTKNTAGLCRSIFILRGESGQVVNDQCLLQYTILDKNCDTVSFAVGAHGNSKKSSKPFYPVKKSTIEALKREVTTKSPSVVYSNASAAAGGIMGARQPGDLPRSRQQMYDLKYKRKKTDDVDELLQYSKHKEEPIILEHHDVPEDLWVLGKKHMTSDLARFCTSEKIKPPL